MSSKKLIYKDNRIIEASYRLTLREQRLVLLCVSQINSLERLKDNKKFVVTASEYSSVFGGDEKHAFRDMRCAIDELYDRSIKVIVNADKTEEIRWISNKSNTLSNQSVEVRFTADIAPYLNNLKGNFTKYQLLNISGMSSIFSIRIYEMLMQWKIKKSILLTVDQLRERLQLSDKYPAFANIKQKVLDVAMKEINEYSDILATYNVLKDGKKVTSVHFSYIYKNVDAAKALSRSEAVDNLKKIKDRLTKP